MSSLLVIFVCSNLVGSESGQKQRVKLLPNMVYNTTQHHPPPPQSHILSVQYVRFVGQVLLCLKKLWRLDISMLFLGIRNAVSERSVPLCSYKCLIVLDTSFMGEDRSCMVLCRNIYCVCMYCIMYLTVSTISRQMCAVSGPAQTEKSSSKENISGQMVHCANDVCWGDRLFIMSGSQGLFTSLQAGWGEWTLEWFVYLPGGVRGHIRRTHRFGLLKNQ